MILRRVIEHFRKQEWTAIFLDFVIVVAGVFIGIQVSNWNAAMAAAQSESKLVARLTNDLGGMRASFREQDLLAARMQQGWIYTLRSLEACEVSAERREAMQFALTHYQSGFGSEVQRAAFDEMTATGVFSRLADASLQNDTTRLYASLESSALGMLGGRDNQLAAGRVMWKSIAFSFERDEPSLDFDSGILASFNPLEHCDDLELRGAVWEMVDAARDWLAESAATVAVIDDLLLRLEKERK